MSYFTFNNFSSVSNKELLNSQKTLKSQKKQYQIFEEDFGKFIYKYFKHWTDSDKEYSKFRRAIHKKISSFLEKSHIIQTEAYRGASKSTTITTGLTLFETLTKKRHYVVIVGANQTSSNEALENIATELLENDLLINDFQIHKTHISTKNIYFTVGTGKRFIPKNKLEAKIISYFRNGLTFDEVIRLWNRSLMNFRSYKLLVKKIYNTFINEPFQVRIRGIGVNVKIRGTNYKRFRPDLIILDDVENDENVNNSLQRDKLYNFFTKAILKLPSRTAHRWNVLVVGTVLHFDGLISRVKKRKDTLSFSYPLVVKFPKNMAEWQNLANMENREKAYQLYLQNKTFYKEGAIIDNPKIDLFEIMMTYFEDIDAFNSEFQNIANSQNNSLSNYTFYTELPDDLIWFLGVDPSEAKNSKSDYMGISIVGKSPSLNKLFSIYNKGFRKTGLDLINLIIELHLKFNFKIIGVEKNLFGMLGEFILKEAKNKKVQLPLKMIHHSSNKKIRLESLGIDFELGNLLLNPEEVMLLNEIKEFPKGRYDDILDSLEIAVSLAKNYFTSRNKNTSSIKRPENRLIKQIKKRRI